MKPVTAKKQPGEPGQQLWSLWLRQRRTGAQLSSVTGSTLTSKLFATSVGVIVSS